MTTWYTPIFLRIAINDIILKILTKKITGLPSRTRRLSWQFFFAALLSFLAFLALPAFMGELSFDRHWQLIFVIGIFNSFGAYCQWRAIDISLSKKSLFTQGDDIITMFLGWVFLGEVNVLTFGIVAGLIICLGAAGAIVWLGRREINSVALLGWIACYSVIWGVAVFFKRFFALEEVTFSTFLTAWYSGSYLGSLFVKKLAGKKESGQRLSLVGVGSGLALGCCVWAPLMLGYWTYKLNYITIAQPFFLVSEMVFPTLIGLYLFKVAEFANRLTLNKFSTLIRPGLFKEFKEVEGITGIQKILFVVAIVGVAIIALSYGHG